MKISILGTRGIPNNHGGFEQFCEYLSVGLANKGHDVIVYNSSEHPFKKNNFNGVTIVSKSCPEKKFGAFAHFYYDFICTKDAIVSKKSDIILHCGYQSAAPSIWFFRRSRSKIVCNMDGLEWERDKWTMPIRLMTKLFEKITVNYCKYLISDNIGIQAYYKNKFNVSSKFIAYGAEVKSLADPTLIGKFLVKPYNYYILVARLEPENNIEIILDGYIKSKSNYPILVIGKTNTKYGRFLLKKFSRYKLIKFLGGIYDKSMLDSVRKYSKLYFHGHTVGGTNPSLLESMALGCLISYHNNSFNKSVLGEDGFPFSSVEDIANTINKIELSLLNDLDSMRKNCVDIIQNRYSWDKIINEYEEYFLKLD